MALSREYTMTINKKTSVLNKNLTISTNDKGIDIIFRLIDCPYISLSLKKNLYARVILLDPLGKQIDSDVTSIIENRVLFRLTKNLMSNITEAGIYKLYIAIMDDKNNVNLLPPVKCTIEESEVEVRGLSVGLINQSGIDNALSTDYGNEISLFNADGSYNRTVWVSGDMITTARMNKLEDAVSNARDHILDIEEKLSLTSERNDLVGTIISPIVIADLPKGFYRITGYIKDFTNKDVYELTGENYFVITYSDDRYSKMQRCLSTEKKFIKYKYDKILETIYLDEQELIVCEQAEGYVRLTLDEYQYIELLEDREAILPNPDGFTEIKVYIDAKESETLTFREVTWVDQLDLTLGTMSVIYLSYINGKWYGRTNSYEDASDGSVPPSVTEGTFRETLVATANGVRLTSTPIQDITLYSNCTIRIPSEFDGKNITLNVLCENGLTVQFLQGTESHEVKLERDTLTVFNINIKSKNSIISRINNGGAVESYVVSNTLINAESNNKITSINKNSRYQAIITAKDNYAMDSISVLMNGVNVTKQYVTPIYEGETPPGGTPTPPGTPPGGEGVATESSFRITAVNPVDIDDNYATGEIVFNRGVGITNLNVSKGQAFDILYCTSAPAVKHEISWDGGRTYQDKTNSIITVGQSSYKYMHEAVSVDSYNMVIRTTDANGNTDSKLFSIIFN